MRGDTLVPAHNLREFDGKRDLYLEFGPNWVWVAPVAVFHSARWLQPKQIQIFKHRWTTSTPAFTSCRSIVPNHSHALMFSFLFIVQINITSRQALSLY